MMTPRAIQLIQDSFAMIVPHRDSVARAFYDNVFSLAPAVRPMFPADLTDQGRS
ncbi:hypothetical protein [Sphingomonas piscis]|uniref:hypothetical protein n=1 Tax=Sphingomonas piscis TaxID=2714943 RepID=UPI0019D2CAB2|nr:hypothetical protein [Sphingomonas piscis]